MNSLKKFILTICTYMVVGGSLAANAQTMLRNEEHFAGLYRVVDSIAVEPQFRLFIVTYLQPSMPKPPYWLFERHGSEQGPSSVRCMKVDLSRLGDVTSMSCNEKNFKVTFHKGSEGFEYSQPQNQDLKKKIKSASGWIVVFEDTESGFVNAHSLAPF